MKKTDDMILRSIFLAPKTDSEFRRRAFNMDISRGELLRMFIEFGRVYLEQNSNIDSDNLQRDLDKLLKKNK
jgi:hypothetical protein